ncbi:MAG: DUF4214 domain-containing protein, partial [Cohaesibacter sp.]|nr:DUF4214 domain-containing protein [Cohaesibacter sp.]
MTGDQQALSIEEILEAVRVEAKAQAPEADQLGKNRRLQNLSIIPVPQQPDDGDALPLNKAVYSIEEFSALDDGDFLSNAYRILLGREVDAEGSGHYLPALQKGRMSRVRVLSALSRSAEGQERGIKIAGLLPASILDRLAGLSGIGRVFEPFMQFLVRSTTNQRLAILSKRHNDLIMDIESALSAIRKNQTSLDMRLTMAEKDADLAQDHARIANN